jgi:hypothetical protein
VVLLGRGAAVPSIKTTKSKNRSCGFSLPALKILGCVAVNFGRSGAAEGQPQFPLDGNSSSHSDRFRDRANARGVANDKMRETARCLRFTVYL